MIKVMRLILTNALLDFNAVINSVFIWLPVGGWEGKHNFINNLNTKLFLLETISFNSIDYSNKIISTHKYCCSYIPVLLLVCLIDLTNP